MNPTSLSLGEPDWITLTIDTDRETALAGLGLHPPGHRPARTAGTSTTGAWPPTRRTSSGRRWPWLRLVAPMPFRRTGWSTTALRSGLTTAALADTPGMSRLAWSSRTCPSARRVSFRRLKVDGDRARLGWAQPPVRRIAVMGTRPYSCEVQWGIFDNAIYRASQELCRLSPQQTVHVIRFCVFVQ